MGEPTIDSTEDTNKPDTKEVDNEQAEMARRRQ